MIDAPIDLVWGVMLDGAAYGQWNPFVVQVDGDIAPGGTYGLRVRWARGGGARSRHLVTRCTTTSW